MRTQWTTKGNRDAGSSCSCDRGLHRDLRNFGGGLNPPNHPLGTPLVCRYNHKWATDLYCETWGLPQSFICDWAITWCAKPMNKGQLKVEPALWASLSATVQLICGSFTTDPITMHHLMSYSYSPGHRILTTDVNCHLFITMKDSGFLLWKHEPGRNHVKCVAENLEVTFLVFQCVCVLSTFQQSITRQWSSFQASSWKSVRWLSQESSILKSPVQTVTKLLHWKPHTLKVLQELQGADSTLKVWFYKMFWEQGVLVKLIHYSLLLQMRLLT